MGRFGGPISDPTDLTPALPSRVALANQICTFAADSISKNGTPWTARGETPQTLAFPLPVHMLPNSTHAQLSRYIAVKAPLWHAFS